MKRVIITGGAGFIGSHLVDTCIQAGYEVLNIDKITYAGNGLNNENAADNKNYNFIRLDINNTHELTKIICDFRPDIVSHLAAETHVDNSIANPGIFIESNIVGTYSLLQAVLRYWNNRRETSRFLFHHVSTDEVFGTLGKVGKFTEESPYQPSSPYSASKASSDHLVRAWNITYALPTLITNTSNNFGPRQNKEKLIPKVIMNAIHKNPIEIYGNGSNIRDWLFVKDHCNILLNLWKNEAAGDTFNIGGDTELTNISIANSICDYISKRMKNEFDYHSLIRFVSDRKGHDFRYAIDNTKLKRMNKDIPCTSFKDSLASTIEWYLQEISLKK